VTTQLEAFRAWVVYWRDCGASGHPTRQLPVDPKPMRAQALKNRPEAGGASDGSFTREAWELARDLVACMAMLDTVEAEIHSTSARFLAGDFVRAREPGTDDDLPF
jgi:hypothetical protein